MRAVLNTWVAGALIAVMSSGGLQPAQADTPHPREALGAFQAPDAEAELRIVELRLRDRQVISADLFAWQTNEGDILLPFAAVAQSLGFALTVETDLSASGWFLRESQRIELNQQTQEVTIAGRRFELKAGDTRTIEGELHISLSALNAWFLLGGTWSPDRQLVNLDPPYLLASEETARRARTTAPGAPSDIDTTGFRRVDPRYAWINWPTVTANLRASLNSAPVQPLADPAAESASANRNVSASLLAQGDLFKTTARLALSASNESDLFARLTLARRDAEAGLLGPLGATHVEAGDIALESLPLLRSSSSGLGVRFGRSDSGVSEEFDRFDLIGDAPPGWQAELYRDAQLLEFQTIAASGRYEFLQTPLVFGPNRFRIELFGPSGERRTVNRTVDIASSLIRPGELRYELAAFRSGASLFGDPAPAQDDLGSPSGALADIVQGQAGIGLTQALSLRAVASHFSADRQASATSAGLGVDLRTGPVFWQATGLWQTTGGAAYRAGALAGAGGATISASHEWRTAAFRNFDIADNASLTRSTTDLAIDTSWRWGGAGLRGSIAERADGSQETTAALRLNASGLGLSASGVLAARELAGDVAAGRRVESAVSVAGSLGPLRLRTSFDAEVSPDYKPRRARIDVSARRGDWFFSAGVARAFSERSTDWTMGASRDFNGLRFGVDTDYRTATDDYRVMASLSLALDRAPDGRIRLGHDARQQRGSVLARVFQDNDGDGRFSPGDAAVDGAGVETFPRARTTPQSKGMLLEDLPVFRTSAMRVDLSGIPDPYLIAKDRGFLVQPRPGAVVKLDIPLIVSGEIELALETQEGQRVPNTVITLKQCSGGDPLRLRTAHDGLAFFGSLVPGCYLAQTNDSVEHRLIVKPGEVTRSTLTQSALTGA